MPIVYTYVYNIFDWVSSLIYTIAMKYELEKNREPNMNKSSWICLKI